MSSKQLMMGAIPIRLAEGQHEIQFQINDPGIVRAAAFTLERRLVMTRGDAQFDEVLTLFVEVAPNGPRRTRRFAVMPTGQGIGAPDGYVLSFVGSAISNNTGQVAHVYEIKEVS